MVPLTGHKKATTLLALGMLAKDLQQLGGARMSDEQRATIKKIVEETPGVDQLTNNQDLFDSAIEAIADIMAPMQ